MEPGELIRLVSRNLSIGGGEVGKITVMNDFSFFELPTDYSDKVMDLNSTTWNGENFKVQVAKGKSDGGGGRRSGRRNGNRNGSRSGGFQSRGRSGDRNGNRAEGSFRRGRGDANGNRADSGKKSFRR